MKNKNKFAFGECFIELKGGKYKMKNKKVIKKEFGLILIGLLVFSLVGTFVLAENETINLSLNNNLIISPEPIAKNSSTNVFMDNIRMRFTFNKEKKAEYSLRIAERRMLKFSEFSEEGKYKQAEKMFLKHETAMERAETYLDEVEANGDVDAMKVAIVQTIFMQNRIEANKERALDIKARILEKHADNMTEEQLAHLEEVFSRVENRTNKSQAKIEQRRENLKLKYKVVSEMTDEEVNASLSEYNNFIEMKRQKRQVQRELKHAEFEKHKKRVYAQNVTRKNKNKN